jgi:hypothetical protein
MLLTDSSSGFDESHDYVNDLSANEVLENTGYIRQSLTGSTTYDENGAYFAPTSYVEFPSMTASIRYIIFYADTGNDATSRVIGIIKLDSVLSLTDKKLRLNFNEALIEASV